MLSNAALADLAHRFHARTLEALDGAAREELGRSLSPDERFRARHWLDLTAR